MRDFSCHTVSFIIINACEKVRTFTLNKSIICIFLEWAIKGKISFCYNFQKLDGITLVLVIYFKEVNGIEQKILVLFMLATSGAQKNLSTCDCSGQPLAFCM